MLPTTEQFEYLRSMGPLFTFTRIFYDLEVYLIL
jgi:hypothetical protein